MKIPRTVSTESRALFFLLLLVLLTGARHNHALSRPKQKHSQHLNPSYCTQLGTSQQRIPLKNFHIYQRTESSKSLVWCSVPKAGSTTIKNLLLRLAHVPQVDRLSSKQLHYREFPRHFPRLRPTQAHKLANATKFLVVRHPFDRLLSAYRDKFEDPWNEGEDHSEFHKRFGQFMVGEDKSGRSPTWPEFLNYLVNTSVQRYDEHWSPIHRLCSPCLLHFDHVVRMERFEEDMGRVLEQTGISAPNLNKRQVTGSSNPAKLAIYFRSISLTTLQKLYRIYKGDFQLFGYSPHKYFQLAKPKASRQLSSTDGGLRTS